MAHFLVGCGLFERDSGFVGAEWLDEGEKGGIAVGKGVEGICNRVMEDVGECVLYWLGRWWQRRQQLLYG